MVIYFKRMIYINPQERILFGILVILSYICIMIYFIGNKQEGKVKIGYTLNSIKLRWRMVQVNCPFQVDILLLIEGMLDTEKHIHQLFNKDHIRGEWFTLSPDIQAFIDNPPKLSVTETFKFVPRVDKISKDNTDIEELYSKGFSAQKIADKLGYTQSQVRRFITRHGLSQKYKRNHPNMSKHTRTPKIYDIPPIINN